MSFKSYRSLILAGLIGCFAFGLYFLYSARYEASAIIADEPQKVREAYANPQLLKAVLRRLAEGNTAMELSAEEVKSALSVVPFGLGGTQVLVKGSDPRTATLLGQAFLHEYLAMVSPSERALQAMRTKADEASAKLNAWESAANREAVTFINFSERLSNGGTHATAKEYSVAIEAIRYYGDLMDGCRYLVNQIRQLQEAIHTRAPFISPVIETAFVGSARVALFVAAATGLVVVAIASGRKQIGVGDPGNSVPRNRRDDVDVARGSTKYILAFALCVSLVIGIATLFLKREYRYRTTMAVNFQQTIKVADLQVLALSTVQLEKRGFSIKLSDLVARIQFSPYSVNQTGIYFSGDTPDEAKMVGEVVLGTFLKLQKEVFVRDEEDNKKAQIDVFLSGYSRALLILSNIQRDIPESQAAKADKIHRRLVGAIQDLRLAAKVKQVDFFSDYSRVGALNLVEVLRRPLFIDVIRNIFSGISIILFMYFLVPWSSVTLSVCIRKLKGGF